MAKKETRVATVSYGEALDVARCYGWIDGHKAGLDDESWLQRFAPRGKSSTWAKANRDSATILTAQGGVKPAGRADVARAKRDGRMEQFIAMPNDHKKASS